MFTIDDKTYRNIQEQVQKNKSDIAAWRNVELTLNTFGISVLGKVDAESDIPENDYQYGDAYLVGEEDPYDLYIYTRDDDDGSFINIGPLAIVGPQGPKGDKGDKGDTGATGPAGQDGQNGATGATGEKGDKGDKGDVGPQGIQGIQGDPGESFMIMGTITNTSQLPNPSTTPRNYAYILDADSNPNTANDLYYIVGETGNESWSYSSFAAAGSTVTTNGDPVSIWETSTKQDALISGTNIKTINNESILGSGNLNVVTDLNGYATEDYVNNAIENIPEVDLNGYATEDYVNNAIANIPEVDLNGYATEDYVNNAIENIPEVDLNGYATKNYVNNAIANIPEPDLSNYATTDSVNTLSNTVNQNVIASLDMSINDSTYVITLQGKDLNGANIGQAQTIDLPLESVVVNGSYENSNIYLELESGANIAIPVGDLVSGLESEINASNKLNAAYVDDTYSTNKFATQSQLNQIADNANDISNIYNSIANISTDIYELNLAAGEITETDTGVSVRLNSTSELANAVKEQSIIDVILPDDLGFGPITMIGFQTGDGIFRGTPEVSSQDTMAFALETLDSNDFIFSITVFPAVDLNGYATEDYVNNAIANIPEVDLNGYATEDYVNNAIANIDYSEYATTANLSNLSNTVNQNVISSFDMSINDSTYVITLQGKNLEGNNIGQAKTIDLPLESVVVNGSYENSNIYLELESGANIAIPVGDLVSGLESEINASNKLNAAYVDDTNSTQKFATQAQLNQIADNANDIGNLTTDLSNLTNTVNTLHIPKDSLISYSAWNESGSESWAQSNQYGAHRSYKVKNESSDLINSLLDPNITTVFLEDGVWDISGSTGNTYLNRLSDNYFIGMDYDPESKEIVMTDISIDETNSTITSGIWYCNISSNASVDLNGYATEDYVNNAIANIPSTDLSNYATINYVNNAIANISTDIYELNLAAGDITETDTGVSVRLNSTSDLANAVKEQSIINVVLPDDLGFGPITMIGFQNGDGIFRGTPEVSSQDTMTFALETLDSDDFIFTLTVFPAVDVNDYATTDYVNNAIANIDMSNYATSSDLANLETNVATVSSEVNTKLNANLSTYQTTAPSADITDNGVHIVYLANDPATFYNGYIYYIAES